MRIKLSPKGELPLFHVKWRCCWCQPNCIPARIISFCQSRLVGLFPPFRHWVWAELFRNENIRLRSYKASMGQVFSLTVKECTWYPCHGWDESRSPSDTSRWRLPAFARGSNQESHSDLKLKRGHRGFGGQNVSTWSSSGSGESLLDFINIYSAIMYNSVATTMLHWIHPMCLPTRSISFLSPLQTLQTMVTEFSHPLPLRWVE